MNETLSVYLNLPEPPGKDMEQLLPKLDALLSEAGWEYSGHGNIYIPLDSRTRDLSAHRAALLLKNADWLRPYSPVAVTGDLTNVCALEEIDVEAMAPPKTPRLYRYENHYRSAGKPAHAIVVDENNRIRSGYITYLLAKKYGFAPPVLSAWSDQPLKKLVYGTHVRLRDGGCFLSSPRVYAWFYEKRPPVIPGDILLARTAKGASFIRVLKIDYATGTAQCKKFQKILAHTGIHVPELSRKQAA